MKKFNCPFCDEVTTEIDDMYEHIEEDHDSNIPERMDVKEFYYIHRTGKTHGTCVMCKRDTKWNLSTSKFNRFCGREKCKEDYVKEVRKRMVGKYGKTTLLNDPEHQKKMLKNRSISGTYKWSDGKHETDYTGSYEKDFLKYVDLFLDFDPNDILMPSPHTYYYHYEGKEHFYIPDVFIPSLNLEIEIKDGGDNPNMHHKIQDVDKVKEKLKDEVMITQKKYSYIKLVNKKYEPFIDFLLKKKEEFVENGSIEKPLFNIGKNSNVPMEQVMEDVAINSTSCLSRNPNEQFERIVNLLENINTFTKKSSIQSNEHFSFKSMNVVMNFTNIDNFNGLTRDIERPVDKKYDLYGIFIKELDETFYNFLSDIIDSTEDHCHSSLEKINTCISGLVASIEDEDDKNILCRDLTSILLSLQSCINYSMTNLLLMPVEKLYCKVVKTIEFVSGSPISNSLPMGFDEIIMESTTLDEYEMLTEADKGKEDKKYPVYVLLTHTGTVLSNAIQKVTDNPYSHSSISFSPELNEMYSFGRKYKSNPLIGTFVKENIKEGLFEDVSDTATYSLYVVFVDEMSYRRMKKKLNEFKEPGKKFRYNFVGLIKHQFGIASTSNDSYFCSQFVDTILNENSEDFFERDSSLVKPYDFAKHKDFLHVSRGKLKNYNVESVKEKVKNLEFDLIN